MAFVALYKDNSEIFVNVNEIQRIAFTKKEDLRQSEREVKVQFIDGSTGVYVANRKLVKNFYNNCIDSAVEACATEESSTEE